MSIEVLCILSLLYYTKKKQKRHVRKRTFTVQKEWWLETESNRRHEDFQSSALPTELSSQHGGPDGNRTRDLLRDRQAC